MSNPINPSTDKVEQSFLPISLKPSSIRFPISYADCIWDLVTAGQTLAAILGQPGQYTQHDINEAFALLINNVTDLFWQLINGGEPADTHNDFTDDFTDDFD